MTRLRHQLHMIRLGRGTAVVLLILVCLVAALGASTANAQSPEDETAPAELCPGLQPLTMIVNLRTLRDGGPLTKTTLSHDGTCSVAVTLSEAEHASEMSSLNPDAVCTVRAIPITTATSAGVDRMLSGDCDAVAIKTSIRLPDQTVAPPGPSGSSGNSAQGQSGRVSASWRGLHRISGNCRDLRDLIAGSCLLFENGAEVVYSLRNGTFSVWEPYYHPSHSSGLWSIKSKAETTGISPGRARSVLSSYRWHKPSLPTWLQFLASAKVRVTTAGVRSCEFNDARFTGGTWLQRLNLWSSCRCEL